MALAHSCRRAGNLRLDGVLSQEVQSQSDRCGLSRCAETTIRFGTIETTLTLRALNSAVECHLHTVEVIGSNPIAPTTSRRFYSGKTASSKLQIHLVWIGGGLPCKLLSLINESQSCWRVG